MSTTKPKEPEVEVKSGGLSDDDVFAFDHGYSNMKALVSSSIKFPTYVLPYIGSFGNPSDPMNNIIYSDDESGKFHVGQSALNIMVSKPDLYKEEEKMDRFYFRNRKYLISVRTAMALAYMKKNPEKTKFKIPIVVTGLPSAFVETDSPELEKVIQGTHKFQLEFDGVTRTYEITVGEVFVIPQPYGTLCLFAYNRQGQLIRPDLLRQRTRVHDWGFKTTDPQMTLDGVTIPGKYFSLTGEYETISSCYAKISDEVRKLTGQVVPIYIIREFLEKGSYSYRNENLRKEVVDLETISEPIFKKAVQNVIKQVIVNDGTTEADNNILTGGGAGISTILNEYKQIYDDLLYPQMEGINTEPDEANVFGYKYFGMNVALSV